MEVKVVSQEMALLSNILAAYTFIADQPERTALVFLGGVCVGLLVTLCAIVFQIHCRADCTMATLTISHRQGTDSNIVGITAVTTISPRHNHTHLDRIWMNGQPDISTVTQSLNRYY
uniref:Eva-1 homolog A (C. elegans) n=1 Tax=Maylandia zebra TaxID=106582 RepID=A0A3P9BWL3_9CICH